MRTSRAIAGILGPAAIALPLTELINLRIWATNIPPLTYLNGTMLFVAGLAIVRAHNRWSRSWPVVVTIAGWGLLLSGLYRMIAPQAGQLGEDPASYALFVALFVAGIFLTIKAYLPDRSSAPDPAEGA